MFSKHIEVKGSKIVTTYKLLGVWLLRVYVDAMAVQYGYR